VRRNFLEELHLGALVEMARNGSIIMEARVMTWHSFGLAALAVLVVLATSSPGWAAMTEAQARAYCAKKAKDSATATRQQLYADRCVQVIMSGQKKK
jgi:hypothetical protein